jgi:hypothetical protein
VNNGQAVFSASGIANIVVVVVNVVLFTVGIEQTPWHSQTQCVRGSVPHFLPSSKLCAKLLLQNKKPSTNWHIEGETRSGVSCQASKTLGSCMSPGKDPIATPACLQPSSLATSEKPAAAQEV